MEISNVSLEAEKEKTAAARASVLAAIALTVFKIVVGLMTNSLGILAEAAHSGLDFVAALVTWIAVRFSGRPADAVHRYGHGKIENLSALVETLLLLGTCVWIIYESIQRLFFSSETVEPSPWAFLVMGVSIVVDINRSRMLYAMARKHNSQALEADALHFSTDIWSSSVVILGLAAVLMTKFFPSLGFLAKADAVAALAVAGIVAYVSVELGLRTVQGLLDHAPAGMAEKIEQIVESIPGVADCHAVRVRASGPGLFVDAHILVQGHKTLRETHQLMQQAEQAVHQAYPKTDLTIHAEPAEKAGSKRPRTAK